jgi:hypothetical protein
MISPLLAGFVGPLDGAQPAPPASNSDADAAINRFSGFTRVALRKIV